MTDAIDQIAADNVCRLTAIANDAVARAETAEARVRVLEKALGTMNAVVDHQTNRVLLPYAIGDVSMPQHVHPLTCGNDSNHTPLFPYWNGERVILRCRDCGYEQQNAAMFGPGGES